MLIERAEHTSYLSNSYLLAEDDGGAGILVDGHGQGAALLEVVEREGISVERIVLTHHHADHVDIDEYLAVFDVPVVAHPWAAKQLGSLVTETVQEGDAIEVGSLSFEVIETPGHTAGHIALYSDAGDGDCLTADLIFNGTVGGTRAPGATGFEDLKHSIVEKILALPLTTVLHPGHREPTTVAQETEHNPFVRIWRGEAEEDAQDCLVGGEPATLILWAPDYDGTNKAWVRFKTGEEAIVGGSQVQR